MPGMVRSRVGDVVKMSYDMMLNDFVRDVMGICINVGIWYVENRIWTAIWIGNDVNLR